MDYQGPVHYLDIKNSKRKMIAVTKSEHLMQLFVIEQVTCEVKADIEVSVQTLVEEVEVTSRPCGLGFARIPA